MAQPDEEGGKDSKDGGAAGGIRGLGGAVDTSMGSTTPESIANM